MSSFFLLFFKKKSKTGRKSFNYLNYLDFYPSMANRSNSAGGHHRQGGGKGQKGLQDV